MKKRSTHSKKVQSPTKKSAMVRRVRPVKMMKVATRIVPKQIAKKSVQTSVAMKAHGTKIRKLGFSLSSLRAGMQMVIALSAVGVIFLLGTVDQNIFSTRQSDAAEETTESLIKSTMTIGLTYTRPLSLSVLIARNQEDAMYASIENGGSELITVNVPSDWKRQEVSGAPLEEVVAGVPTFGFTAWTLPAHATVKFSGSKVPGALFFDTSADTTAAITLKTVRVDGELSTANSKVVLLKKQTLVPLWVQD